MIKKILSKAVTSLAGRDDFEIPEHDSPLFVEIDWDKLPRHVAVIMDGNGRWGKEHSVLRTAGHSAGVGTLKNILKTAIGLKLDALTVCKIRIGSHIEIDAFHLVGLREFLYVDYDA